MIVLPWYIRFSMDSIVFLTPLVYMMYHPTTHVLEFFRDKRRLVRRKCIFTIYKAFENYKYLDQNTEMKSDEVKKLYSELGIEIEM